MKSVHQDLSYSSPRFSRQGASFLFTAYFFLFLFFLVCVCMCVCIHIYICPLFSRSSTILIHLFSFLYTFFLLLTPTTEPSYLPSLSLVDRDLSLSFGTVLAFFFFFFLTCTHSLHPAISLVHLARGMITPRAPRLKCLTVCILGPDCSPR